MWEILSSKKASSVLIQVQFNQIVKQVQFSCEQLYTRQQCRYLAIQFNVDSIFVLENLLIMKQSHFKQFYRNQ